MHPHNLPPDWRERFEERAAICEFEGGLSRADAERFAIREIERLMREVEQLGDGK
jgi:hypothetical protein